jgi:tetratricopeptide (TPR) repeat protein
MAAPASSPKIEELRGRLKTDPKNRIFYPLAEELRKIGQTAEAEQVLLTGLTHHPTYLSAWVSLGRVQRDTGNNDGAVESLSKALQLDPGNVVAARLLGDAYLALDQKVEAIKKYKLVHALMPSDEELETLIERLDNEINPIVTFPPPVEAEAAPEPPPAEATPWQNEAPEPEAAPGLASGETTEVAIPQPAFEQPVAPVAPAASTTEEMPWQTEDIPPPPSEREEEIATGDVEPMAAAHAESPFEEPAADLGYSADAFSIEQPEGMHLAGAPLAAELPAPLGEELPPPEAEPVIEPEAEAGDVFAPAEDESAAVEAESDKVIEVGIASDMPFPITAELPPPSTDDFAKTITMADLYANQGLVDEARDIYEDILARDPDNEAVRAKLDALNASGAQEAAYEEEPAYEEEEEPAVAEVSAFEQGSVFEAQQPMFEEAPFAQEPPFTEEPLTPAPLPAPRGEGTGRAKIARLEGWLARVSRRELGGL